MLCVDLRCQAATKVSELEPHTQVAWFGWRKEDGAYRRHGHPRRGGDRQTVSGLSMPYQQLGVVSVAIHEDQGCAGGGEASGGDPTELAVLTSATNCTAVSKALAAATSSPSPTCATPAVSQESLGNWTILRL